MTFKEEIELGLYKAGKKIITPIQIIIIWSIMFWSY